VTEGIASRCSCHRLRATRSIAGASPDGRIAARTTAIGPDWHANFPADPAAATQAYLDRVPAEARARGDAYMDGRYVALAGRLAAPTSGDSSMNPIPLMRSSRANTASKASRERSGSPFIRGTCV